MPDDDVTIDELSNRVIKPTGKLSFQIISRAGGSRCRHGVLRLTHGSVDTPVFMPVGTQG